MKKTIFFTIFLSLFCSYVSTTCNYLQEEAGYDWAITIKNGYFHPRDKVLRCIFDRCGKKGGYWFEGAVRRNVWKRLDVEASGSYFRKEGKALCGTECTRVSIPTFGLGLKYFFSRRDCSCCIDKFSFFVGTGLRVFFYKEKNGSPFVNPCFKKTTAGGMVNVGFEYDVREHFLINLFFDYNFKKLKPCDKNCCNQNCDPYRTGILTSCCPSYFCNVDLGGFVFGIGLGGKF
ncbi:hypothetical protein ACFLYA_00955 [Candidatus Dependentiae bacterium]